MTAMQSPEVPQEDQDDRSVHPVLPEAMVVAVGAGQDEIRQDV
jgi:hypothetical protein